MAQDGDQAVHEAGRNPDQIRSHQFQKFSLLPDSCSVSQVIAAAHGAWEEKFTDGVQKHQEYYTDQECIVQRSSRKIKDCVRYNAIESQSSKETV